MITLLDRGQIKKLLVASVFVVIGVVAFLFIYNKHDVPNISIQKTNMSVQNLAYISNNSLYSYNGAAFIKTAVSDSSKSDVLASGIKLRPISFYEWAGDDGIFLSFENSSFIRSKPEIIDQIAGADYSEDSSEVLWYLRFSDSSFTQVDTIAPAPSISYYSDKDKGFYYISENSDKRERGEGTPAMLMFYSTRDLKNRTVAIDSGFIYDRVAHVAPCTGYIVCAYGEYETGSSRVYGFDTAGNTSPIYQAKGFISPTNKTDSISIASPTETSGGEDQSVEFNMQTYSLTDKKLVKINASAYSPTLQHVQLDNGLFYILSAGGRSVDDASTIYSGGNNILNVQRATKISLSLTESKPFNQLFTGNVSFSSGGDMLFTSGDGFVYIIQNERQIKLPQTSAEDAKKIVDSCIKYGVLQRYYSESREFKIYFNDDNSFDESIRTFSRCVNDASGNSLMQYHFYFGGVSPKNGRFTTD